MLRLMARRLAVVATLATAVACSGSSGSNGGSGGGSNPPSAPTGLVAAPGDGKVTLSWAAATGATSYDVYYSTSAGVTPGGQGVTKIASATSPYAQTGLQDGTTYHFVVTALNAKGESAASAEVTATPNPVPYIGALVLSFGSGGASPFGFSEQVQVCSDETCSTPISSATVSVNGTALTYDSGRGSYLGNFAVGLGQAVTVSATIGATTYTASGIQFTQVPTVTAPTSGATWSHTASNTISWTGGAPTSGASYAVGVLDTGTGNFAFPASTSGHGGPEELPIGTTSTVVPAGTLVASGSYAVMAGIGTTGIASQTSGGIAFSAPTATGSGLWLGAISPLVNVTVN